ncbi:homoserine acetyltransferase family protein [Metarhizium album ARSEF 1941]|uniref:Homoserine acetyltransferase family protein n=1 Tax=Metarhizium album (strain ARSEF 1941) TaxID=1081103 RepID=A0A0B2WWX9_METAS|nr:homoserine acetyltransferase family protein [Metarhizium album ARSEF 1941]KHN97370.1 homoserine acetyltransferase family protein [Metarhizium album ARSEF 1941]
MDGYKTYHLGDFELVSGETIPSASIAYKTAGDARLPAVIYPSWFSGAIEDNEWLVGDDKALSPSKYYIIMPAMFGNGQSSSPSNWRPPPGAPPFPDVTIRDNVTAQHRLVTECLGVTHARCILGWSMGACQTYQWVTQYPGFADLAVPFCGSARTSLHNQVFLEGVKSALLAARGAASAGSCRGEAAGPGSRPWTADERAAGLKALARVYAGWGFSQAFYRQRLYETALGYTSLEDFMQNFWEKWALSKDPDNLLVMLRAWQAGDCSDQEPYNKDLELALKSIRTRMLVLPGREDLYFPPEDSEYEVQCMEAGVGTCIPIPSIWGHWAGGPGLNPDDVKWLDDKLRAFLEDQSTLTGDVGVAK